MSNLRNLSKAVESAVISGVDAVWTTWTIDKAVKEGYTVCGWVYKAVNIVSRNGATVPFVVKDRNDEILWEHPTTKLLLNPHPFLNRVQFFELLIDWLQLAGNAYLHKVDNRSTTAELWPISPDRLQPIESADNSKFIDGYKEKKSGNWVKSNDFDADNIIQFSLIDPSNPILGIAPLQAAAKAVDLDVAQQKWNTGTMQNRGVVDSVFTFDKPIDKIEGDSIKQRIMEKFSSVFGRREPLILGSNAKYTRLSLTPVEVDFLNSRKFNMSEIFITFGVPPQLGGSEESATYNNFAESLRILWETTEIPLLNMMAQQFTQSFKDQLKDGQYISPDYSNVAALRDSLKEKAETSKIFYDIGIPVEQLNTKFELGFEPYDKWDQPFNGTQQVKAEVRKKWQLIPTEKRNAQSEADKRDRIAEGKVTDLFTKFFAGQSADVYMAVMAGNDPMDAVKKTRKELFNLVSEVAYGVSAEFSKTVIVDQRGNKPDFEKRGTEEEELIEEFYKGSDYILTEISEIQQSTVDAILKQVREAAEKNWTVEQLRQAIEDTGIFSPERALRIARTEVGTAASIGQVVSGKLAGAETKTWEANWGARSIHSNRDGETVGIDDRFSIQDGSVGPRFPSDFQTSAADRINCRCFTTFGTL